MWKRWGGFPRILYLDLSLSLILKTKKADEAERIRREKLLVHLRAKNPGRVIEEWELDAVQDQDQDK
jgi:hypothetical protein